MNQNFNIQAFEDMQNQHFENFDNAQLQNNEEDEQPRNDAFAAEAILEEQNDRYMQVLCNFNCIQFTTLFNIVGPRLIQAHTGGKKSVYSPRTIFLITLTYLKNAPPFNFMSMQFGRSVPYLSSLIAETVAICAPLLAKAFYKVDLY